MTVPVASLHAADLTAVRVAAIRDVLGRLLHPSDAVLARCRYVVVDAIGPGQRIAPIEGRGAIITVGRAAREVLFEAAHVLAEELGVGVPAS